MNKITIAGAFAALTGIVVALSLLPEPARSQFPPVGGGGSSGSAPASFPQQVGVTTSPTAAAPTTGVFSSVIAASGTRKGCLIQNVGTTLGYVYFGANGSATTSNSFQVAANGGSINCSDTATIEQGNVSATCASGTCAFIVKSE